MKCPLPRDQVSNRTLIRSFPILPKIVRYFMFLFRCRNFLLRFADLITVLFDLLTDFFGKRQHNRLSSSYIPSFDKWFVLFAIHCVVNIKKCRPFLLIIYIFSFQMAVMTSWSIFISFCLLKLDSHIRPFRKNRRLHFK